MKHASGTDSSYLLALRVHGPNFPAPQSSSLQAFLNALIDKVIPIAVEDELGAPIDRRRRMRLQALRWESSSLHLVPRNCIAAGADCEAKRTIAPKSQCLRKNHPAIRCRPCLARLIRVLKPLAEEHWYPQTELPDPAPDDGHPGAEYGAGEGHPDAPAAFETGHHDSRVYAGTAGERAGDGRVGQSNVDERREEKTSSEDLLPNATNASEEML